MVKFIALSIINQKNKIEKTYLKSIISVMMFRFMHMTRKLPTKVTS